MNLHLEEASHANVCRLARWLGICKPEEFTPQELRLVVAIYLEEV